MSRDSDEPKDKRVVVWQTEDGGWSATAVLDVDDAKKQLEDARKLMPEEPRAAVRIALTIAIKVMLEKGLGSDLLAPIFTLADQFRDLDKGISGPLFEPRRAEGGTRPGRSTRYVMNMIAASVAITIAGRGNMESVTRRAAQKLNVEPSKLRNFRKNVMAKKIKDPAADWYFVQLRMLSPVREKNRDTAVEALLGFLSPLD